MKRVPRPSKLSPTVDLGEIFRTTNESSGNAVLTKGVDFDCAPSTAAGVIRDEWRRVYGDISVTTEGDTVVVQIDPGKAQKK